MPPSEELEDLIVMRMLVRESFSGCEFYFDVILKRALCVLRFAGGRICPEGAEINDEQWRILLNRI